MLEAKMAIRVKEKESGNKFTSHRTIMFSASGPDLPAFRTPFTFVLSIKHDSLKFPHDSQGDVQIKLKSPTMGG